jgi:hypothetical protein
MQGDIIGLSAQVLLAQRWSGVRQIGVGGQHPHGAKGVVLAE